MRGLRGVGRAVGLLAVTAVTALSAAGPDRDRDGIPDAFDLCADTPAGTQVDVFCCARATPQRLDTDGDGIPDIADLCSGTPAKAVIDAYGCPFETDSDGDGVPDHADPCPRTPPGAQVDAQGCAIDSDFDGVPDGLDQCQDTPLGTPATGGGCAVDGSDQRAVDVRVELPRSGQPRPLQSLPAVTPPPRRGMTPTRTPPPADPTPRMLPLAGAVVRSDSQRPTPVVTARPSPSPSPSPTSAATPVPTPTPVAAPAPPAPESTPTPTPTPLPIPSAVSVPGRTQQPARPSGPRSTPWPTAAPQAGRAPAADPSRIIRVGRAAPSVAPPMADPSLIWRLVFDAGSDYEISGAQISGLRAMLAPHREALLRSGRGQVQLIGLGRTAGDLGMARRVRVARALVVGLGIPPDRVIYAVRTAEGAEASGVVEVHIRGIAQ